MAIPFKGTVTLMDGSAVDAEQRFEPVSVDTYYIVPNKCTECQGFTKSHSAPLYARLTAAFLTKCIVKP